MPQFRLDLEEPVDTWGRWPAGIQGWESGSQVNMSPGVTVSGCDWEA